MSDDAAALVTRAHAVRRDGDAGAALALYRQAEAAFGADRSGRAHCLRHIGDLEREAGRRDVARGVLLAAESIYRDALDDPLLLANTVRLLALVEDDPSRWQDARALYATAGKRTGLDMGPALLECDRHLREV